RFCAYADKVFGLGERLPTLTDSRTHPRIKTAAAFAAAFTLFATRRGSLNGLEQDLRIPARLRGLVGAGPPGSTPSAAPVPGWTADRSGDSFATSPIASSGTRR